MKHVAKLSFNHMIILHVMNNWWWALTRPVTLIKMNVCQGSHRIKVSYNEAVVIPKQLSVLPQQTNVFLSESFPVRIFLPNLAGCLKGQKINLPLGNRTLTSIMTDVDTCHYTTDDFLMCLLLTLSQLTLLEQCGQSNLQFEWENLEELFHSRNENQNTCKAILIF